MLAMMNFMNGEKQTRGSRPHVPVYGSGIVPTYFTGSAARSDVPYSKGAKIVGFLMALALVLLMAWLILSMIRAAA
ncbi:MAG: hypothetical protein R6W91_03930 [Thermoplasmata archaeon]